MTFIAPALFTEINPDGNLYPGQFDSNFSKLQAALIQIQNELAKASGSFGSTGASNLTWIQKMLSQNGPIGFDSWIPSFTNTTDGIRFSLLHTSTPSGFSSAIINGLLHSTDTVLTWDLETLVPAGDGPFRIVVGLNSAGAPAIEQVVERNESPTDDPELPLYQFNYVVKTDGPEIQDLVRLTQWHGNDSAWAELRDRPTVLQTMVERLDANRWTSFNGTGYDTDGVFLIPFDCRVVGAAAYLSHEPAVPAIGTGKIEVELVRFGFTEGGLNDRSERIHQGTWIWGEDTDALTVREMHELPALDPEAQLLKGDYVNVKLLDPDPIITDGPNPVADEERTLVAQLRILPIQHDPMKSNA